MSNLQAALGVAQFERADELVESKRRVFRWYKEALADVPDISLNVEQPYAKNSYWMPTVVLDDSYRVDIQQIIRRMNENGVAARPFFYPVSGLPMYHSVEENVVGRNLNRSGVNLPSYFDMDCEGVQFVAAMLIENLT
jgi:perosamine synthetase